MARLCERASERASGAEGEFGMGGGKNATICERERESDEKKRTVGAFTTDRGAKLCLERFPGGDLRVRFAHVKSAYRPEGITQSASYETA